ncbi:MAG: murein biosynthesis integral membrane protein MurJ [Coriobacteriia bacterium]|nr:murein biosynthesis integral membrane protein MurJ [Coriobacteriia bacterium]
MDTSNNTKQPKHGRHAAPASAGSPEPLTRGRHARPAQEEQEQPIRGRHGRHAAANAESPAGLTGKMKAAAHATTDKASHVAHAAADKAADAGHAAKDAATHAALVAADKASDAAHATKDAAAHAAHVAADKAADAGHAAKDAATHAADAAKDAAQATASKAKAVVRSTAIMSACTLASRATGFIRTWAMAFALGNTVLAAGFSLANNLPNMIYELVAGGVLSTAFLPIYLQQLNNRGREDANRYASNLFSLTVIVLGVIALAASIFAPQVMVTQSLFSNASDVTVEHAVWFFRFFAFQIVFYGISAIIGGILNAEREYFWPAISSIFMNIITIATFLIYRLCFDMDDPAGLVLLGVGVTASIAVMAFVQVPALMKTGFRFRFVLLPKGDGLRETLRLAVPAIATTAINLVGLSFMNSCALNVSDTGPASVNYAWMWYMFPYGVLGVALSTALFTEMGEATAQDDWARFKRTLVGGLRLTLVLIIPMAAMVFACANQLVGLYSAGRFTPADIAPIAGLLKVWAINLPLYAGYMFVYRAYSAMKDMKTVAICNAILTVGQVTLYMTFTGVLIPGFSLGLQGLALADICFYTVMLLTLLAILHKRMSSLGLRDLGLPVLKMFDASMLGGAAACMTGLLLECWMPVSSTFNALFQLVLMGCVGLGVIFGLAKVLKVEEITSVIGAVARKLGKK